jgi:hypothetical protein
MSNTWSASAANFAGCDSYTTRCDSYSSRMWIRDDLPALVPGGLQHLFVGVRAPPSHGGVGWGDGSRVQHVCL